ncbi:hypothetical protein [Paraburkholderia kururiensis]|uniref:Uncharacterized protein n=1 Tax=Paraburkholderia kururiensis TaxID=984307 RepID=A0ABZ0WFF0_9BURK|nr:hypothetical protein [Paraburkholderia kururiensis]WQD76049.1 hypothetical protein U0042_18235 [Paraburkholderia kururiensis]
MTNQLGSLLSVPLDQGKYPFALDRTQLKMTGDDWAWKFLRLNPGYRRDYELLQSQPGLLTTLRRHLRNGRPGSEWFERAKELDVRYFSLNGKVLGPQCKWPHAAPLTLKEFLDANPDIDPRRLRVRDFDSVRLYGIGDWFDPSSQDLPKLDEEQSWFFNLTEPIFSVGKPFFFAGRDSVWKAGPTLKKISVGYAGNAKFVEPPVVYGRIESYNDRGEQVVSFGRIENLPRKRAFEVLYKDGTLIRVDVPTITPFLFTGFVRESEMAFAVSLDGHIKPQLRANQKAALHYQELMCRVSSQPLANYASTDPEPQVLPFRPDRPAAIPFSAIRTDLSALARDPASAWQNWHVALIDVAYSLPQQFKAVEKQLQAIQQRLGSSKRLANPIRQRAGTTNHQEFWLKRALCMLELQLGLPKRANSPTGADRIANAIYDQTDPYHKTIWGESGWKACPKQPAPESEKLKKALRTGIDLAMHQYTFLIGAAPIDLVGDDSLI